MIGSQSFEEIQKKSIGKRSRFDEFSDSEYVDQSDQSDRNNVTFIDAVEDTQAANDELKQEEQEVVDTNDTTIFLISNDQDQNVTIPKSKQLANDIISYPIPPDLDFSDQTASKASVLLVQKYLKQNPNYPLKKKIETNLNNQIIPKLCEGDYQLQPSTKGYTAFDAKVVPWNGKQGWLRYKTQYAGIIKHGNAEESEATKDRCDKKSAEDKEKKARGEDTSYDARNAQRAADDKAKKDRGEDPSYKKYDVIVQQANKEKRAAGQETSYDASNAKAAAQCDEDYTTIYNLSNQLKECSSEQKNVLELTVNDMIKGNAVFKKIWNLENNVEIFIENLPSAMIQRDLWLERENAKKVVGQVVIGRKGNLKQWKMIVNFYAEHFGLNKSFYSGEKLTTLQRAGLFMMSFQRSNDLWYYFENFLRWILYICSSLEQRMFPQTICKTWALKMDHLGLIVQLWNEGRGSHSEMPTSPTRKLTGAEIARIKVIHSSQKSNSKRKNQGERQGDFKKLKLFCSSNFRSKTLWSRGNWEPSTPEAPNPLLLSIDSMISKTVYDYEAGTHFAEFWWLNDCMESQTKAYEDELIRDKFALRAEKYKSELAELVRAKEVEAGLDKYEKFAGIFGRMAGFIQKGMAEKSGIWKPNFAEETESSFHKYLWEKHQMSMDQFMEL